MWFNSCFSHSFATLNVNPKLIILPYASFYKVLPLSNNLSYLEDNVYFVATFA